MSDESNEAQKEADLALVKLHVSQLGEHFDNVQIFVNRHMPSELDGTRSFNYGSGNWFARYGQITEWLKYENGRIEATAFKNENAKDD